MSRYIVKRLLYLIPMLFCVVLLIFLIMGLSRGFIKTVLALLGTIVALVLA